MGPSGTNDSALAHGEPTGDFDVHAPLASLPGVFGTTLDTIPAKVPYLFSDSVALDEWQLELAGERRLKVGINWQGSQTTEIDASRSFPLSLFARIAQLQGVALYSLQIGAGREQLADFARTSPIIDLADRLGDFYNTAAVVCNLDLVISCDSAPVHLAGGLGVKTWLSQCWSPHWTWMLDRDDSPWYPTLRLFRQGADGNWASAVAKAVDALHRAINTVSE